MAEAHILDRGFNIFNTSMPRFTKPRRHQAYAHDNEVYGSYDDTPDVRENEPPEMSEFELDTAAVMALGSGLAVDVGAIHGNESVSPYQGLVNHYVKTKRQPFTEEAFTLSRLHVGQNYRKKNGSVRLSVDPGVVNHYLYGDNKSPNFVGILEDFRSSGKPKPYIEWDLRKGREHYIFSVNGKSYKDYVRDRVDDRDLRRSIARSKRAEKALDRIQKAKDPDSNRSRKAACFKNSIMYQRAQRRAAEERGLGDSHIVASDLNGSNGEATGSDDVVYEFRGVTEVFTINSLELLTSFELYCLASDRLGFDLDLYAERGSNIPVDPSHEEFFLDSFAHIILYYVTLPLDDEGVVEVPVLGIRLQVSMRVIKKLARVVNLNGNNGSYTNTDDHKFTCFVFTHGGVDYFIFQKKMFVLKDDEYLVPYITEQGDEITFVKEECVIPMCTFVHKGCVQLDGEKSCRIKTPMMEIHCYGVSEKFPSRSYQVIEELFTAEVNHWIGSKNGVTKHAAVQYRIGASGYFPECFVDWSHEMTTAVLHRSLTYAADVSVKKLDALHIVTAYNPDKPFRGLTKSGGIVKWKGEQTVGNPYHVRKDWFHFGGAGFEWSKGDHKVPFFKNDGIGKNREKTVFFRIRPANEFVYPCHSANNVSFAMSRLLKCREPFKGAPEKECLRYEKMLITNQTFVFQDQMSENFKHIVGLVPDGSSYRRASTIYPLDGSVFTDFGDFRETRRGLYPPEDGEEHKGDDTDSEAEFERFDLNHDDIIPGFLLFNDSYNGRDLELTAEHRFRTLLLRACRNQVNAYVRLVSKSWWTKMLECLGWLGQSMQNMWDQFLCRPTRNNHEEQDYAEEFMAFNVPPVLRSTPRSVPGALCSIAHLIYAGIDSSIQDLALLYADYNPSLKNLRRMFWNSFFVETVKRQQHKEAGLISSPEVGFKDEDCKFGKDGRLFVSYKSLAVLSGYDSMVLKYHLCVCISSKDLFPGSNIDFIVVTVMNVSVVAVSYAWMWALAFSVDTPLDDQTRGICLVFSDDSFYFFVRNRVLRGKASDFESNDTGMTAAFAAVHALKSLRSPEVADVAIRAMCTPFKIEHPNQKDLNNKKAHLIVTPTGMVMGSGLPDTTGANHIENANTSMMTGILVCSHPDGHSSFAELSCTVAEAFGQRVKVEDVEKLQKGCFLKRAFMHAEEGPCCPLVWGALLKSFGTVYGVLQASHVGMTSPADLLRFNSMTDIQKMEIYFSAVVAGYCCEPRSAVLDAMRLRFAHKDGVANPVFKHNDMNTSRTFSKWTVPDSEWAIRYDFAPSELHELCQHIVTLTLGDTVYCPLMDKIMNVDYGVPFSAEVG